MLVKVPEAFVNEFLGKSEKEINDILEVALYAHFNKPESEEPPREGNVSDSITVSLLMEILDKVEDLGIKGLVPPVTAPIVTAPVVTAPSRLTADELTMTVEPDPIDIESTGDEDLDDLMFDIMK